MTNAELNYFERVPHLLAEIASELKKMNENKVAPNTLSKEVERLRDLSMGERLFPQDFDRLVKEVGGKSWKETIEE